MSGFPVGQPHSRSDAVATAVVVGLGLAAAAVAGLAAAKGNLIAIGGLLWLGLVLIGLRYPALPFALTVIPYVLSSTSAGDNALLAGAEAAHAGVVGPLTPADVLMTAAAVAAFAAFARMPPERRSLVRTALTAPLLLLLAAGAFSGLVIHREGGGALLALFPLFRLTAMFLIGCLLIAGWHVRLGHVTIWTIVGAELVGAIGIYNALGGGTGENTISETTLPGGEAPVDERTLAFVDAAAPFVMAFGLALILTRALWSTSRDRWLLLALGILPFAGLVLSARRAMWIDFAIAAAVIVLVSASVDRRVLVGAIVALSVGGVAFVSLTQSSPAYQERIGGITTVFSGQSTESNIRSRQIETRAVWENIREHPLEGIGLTAPYLSNVQFQYQEPTYLHNNVLWVWLKFGLLGLIALLWLIWRTARLALEPARTLAPSGSLTDAQAGLAASATMLGFFVAMLTASFLTASIRPPALAGLLLAIAATTATRIASSRPAA